MTASNADIDALLERVFRKETLSEREITGVCDHVKEILKRESNMQLVTAPVVVVGDIHGQFYDLLELFHIAGRPPHTNYLFWATTWTGATTRSSARR